MRRSETLGVIERSLRISEELWSGSDGRGRNLLGEAAGLVAAAAAMAVEDEDRVDREARKGEGGGDGE